MYYAHLLLEDDTDDAAFGQLLDVTVVVSDLQAPRCQPPPQHTKGERKGHVREHVHIWSAAPPTPLPPPRLSFWVGGGGRGGWLAGRAMQLQLHLSPRHKDLRQGAILAAVRQPANTTLTSTMFVR